MKKHIAQVVFKKPFGFSGIFFSLGGEVFCFPRKWNSWVRNTFTEVRKLKTSKPNFVDRLVSKSSRSTNGHCSPRCIIIESLLLSVWICMSVRLCVCVCIAHWAYSGDVRSKGLSVCSPEWTRVQADWMFLVTKRSKCHVFLLESWHHRTKHENVQKKILDLTHETLSSFF